MLVFDNHLFDFTFVEQIKKAVDGDFLLHIGAGCGIEKHPQPEQQNGHNEPGAETLSVFRCFIVAGFSLSGGIIGLLIVVHHCSIF